MKTLDGSGLGKIIGYGTSADIHDWKPGQIIKLFWPNTPEEPIEREKSISIKAYEMGIPSPEVIETVIINKGDGERTGIVFEKIADGMSMLEEMFTKPDEIESRAKEMAKLHAAIHKNDVTGIELPNVKPVLLNALQEYAQNIMGLDSEKQQRIIKILESLPEGKKLCHNDFHPGNIILSEKGAYIIDWLTAGIGDQKFDVAKTEMLMKYGSLPEDIPEEEKRKINELRLKFLEIYIQEYTKITGLDTSDLDDYKLPMYAARLIYNNDKAEVRLVNKGIDEILNSLKP